jgi:FKBP-type peptidyl-prolyl cis-trans isomerase FkpA
LMLMKKGGKATFLIPPAIGYGEQGGGPIPGNTPLVFEVELLDFKKGQ